VAKPYRSGAGISGVKIRRRNNLIRRNENIFVVLSAEEGYWLATNDINGGSENGLVKILQ